MDSFSHRCRSYFESLLSLSDHASSALVIGSQDCVLFRIANSEPSLLFLAVKRASACFPTGSILSSSGLFRPGQSGDHEFELCIWQINAILFFLLFAQIRCQLGFSPSEFLRPIAGARQLLSVTTQLRSGPVFCFILKIPANIQILFNSYISNRNSK
jgi:hypothetical protein